MPLAQSLTESQKIRVRFTGYLNASLTSKTPLLLSVELVAEMIMNDC